MSRLDIMTDAEVEELQRKALYVETAEFYSAMIQALYDHIKGFQLTEPSTCDIKSAAKAILQSGTIDHPYEVACREALPVIDQYDE